MRRARAIWSGYFGIWIEAQTSSMSRHGSHDAATPKVSIGTVELRPQVTRNDRWRGLSAKCRSTSPQTNSLSSSTFDPWPACTGGLPGFSASSAFDDERQRLIDDAQLFGGIFGQRAGIGDNRRDPFAGIARLADRQRKALHMRRIETVHQRVGGTGEFIAGQHVVHARHRQRGGGIDRHDPCGRMLRRQHRDMQHAFERDVGDIAALPGHETAVLADAAIAGDEAEG